MRVLRTEVDDEYSDRAIAEGAGAYPLAMETHTLRALVRIMARKVGVLFGGVCQPCFGLEQGLGRLRRPARVARRRSVRGFQSLELELLNEEDARNTQ